MKIKSRGSTPPPQGPENPVFPRVEQERLYLYFPMFPQVNQVEAQVEFPLPFPMPLPPTLPQRHR